MNKSRNDNNDDLLTGAFNVFGDHIKKKMQNCIPVKVTKVSSDRKFVNVQPQILVVGSDGSTISRGEIKGVPVFTSGAGNFLMSFNISVGDLGWVEASDRDISIFKQSYSEVKPNTRRMHSLEDGRFIPDIMTNFTISGEDAEAVVIQNRDGTVKIALDKNEIRVQQNDIKLALSGGKVVGVAPSGFDLNGAKITSGGDVITASGVSLDGHPHDQAVDSGGNSQEPTAPPTPTE